MPVPVQGLTLRQAYLLKGYFGSGDGLPPLIIREDAITAGREIAPLQPALLAATLSSFSLCIS